MHILRVRQQWYAGAIALVVGAAVDDQFDVTRLDVTLLGLTRRRLLLQQRRVRGDWRGALRVLDDRTRYTRIFLTKARCL